MSTQTTSTNPIEAIGAELKRQQAAAQACISEYSAKRRAADAANDQRAADRAEAEEQYWIGLENGLTQALAIFNGALTSTPAGRKLDQIAAILAQQ